MGFSWTWRTKAGVAMPENQDHAGIAVLGNSLLAIISDGIASRPGSGELTDALTRNLIDIVVTREQPPTSDELSKSLKDASVLLKQSCYPSASAAFLAACFSRDKLTYTIHAGDCRIGMKSTGGNIAWRTEVHSLANAITPLNEESLRMHPARNQLTRSFRLRRFKEPEVTRHECIYVEGAVLATDGFWAGLSVESQNSAFGDDWSDPPENQDDTSHLIIRWSEYPQIAAEEGGRIYVKSRHEIHNLPT